MFSFRHIALTQFRNYLFESFDFSERIVGICGANGSGKTNLLDAVYYLCFTRSYFSRTDGQNVHHGLQGLRLEAQLAKNGADEKLVCIVRENNKKEFYANDEEYKKFSDHIGLFPAVMIAPDDTELITGGSEERRKFLDTLLSQLFPGYLQQLIAYNKILQQRNSLLKAAAEHRRLDHSLLEILDIQLCERGDAIYQWRRSFIDQFIPLVQQQYTHIAGKDDLVQLQYDSQLNTTPLATLLQQNRQRDMHLQRTTCGIHKDDIDIFMNGLIFKNIASQGQRKSLLFAIKLSEFITLKQHKGFTPVLLLDDVFEKLDASRMHNLLHRVCVEEEGQVFITDTHKERLEKAFTDLSVVYQLVQL
ncbi:DNA replication and repair protein RecF [Filimonas lacunae]|uniref:DNA replication and repair protein RecF n=1 Tax=Filimonas lacunae TaxID=477680 RepID=A0A173MKU6_9BACT|nr:DNA replication and repair protein RecF [Filimonas lacunae]BAV08089.1 DNA recombination and repair protein RecF [Filimonas lacunae]SIT09154.1 DNA replication and repair protein RecF [Filimonas lacunae]